MQSAFETKEAYFKSLGYRFEDGKLESTNEYLNRLESCMKLFGALLQVCIIVFQLVNANLPYC